MVTGSGAALCCVPHAQAQQLLMVSHTDAISVRWFDHSDALVTT